MHEHKQTHSHPSLENLLIDRDQATTQLEALSHSLNNAYLSAFLPKEDPRYGSNTARKADRLNWQEIESWQAQGYGANEEVSPFLLGNRRRL
jgi:hypothetical protein